LFGEYGVQPAKISAPKGKEAALRALEIDGNLAEAFTALAYINTNYEWNFEEAEKNYQRAIQLNPQYATARQWYGEYLTQMTRFDEAAAQIRLALEFDPLSLIINQQLAELLMFQGKYDEAISTTKKTLEIDPNFPGAWGITGWAYEEKKMYDEAVAAYIKADAAAGESQDFIASLENSYKKGGWQGYLEKILQLKKEKFDEEIDQAGAIALQYALLGKKDEALKWLEVSYQNREDNMAWLKVETAWNFMRSDPRFQSLMKRVGFPQ
jgi:tetratricopeptide (TPR) repeat protein